MELLLELLLERRMELPLEPRMELLLERRMGLPLESQMVELMWEHLVGW
jgi:hypothetical protein